MSVNQTTTELKEMFRSTTVVCIAVIIRTSGVADEYCGFVEICPGSAVAKFHSNGES